MAYDDPYVEERRAAREARMFDPPGPDPRDEYDGSDDQPRRGFDPDEDYGCGYEDYPEPPMAGPDFGAESDRTDDDGYFD